MTDYCFEILCKRIADWRFEVNDNWFYSCAAHLGSMKQTLSMLGLKVDWVGNTLHLARPEIYGPQDEKKK
jgi:hypothetical protein